MDEKKAGENWRGRAASPPGGTDFLLLLSSGRQQLERRIKAPGADPGFENPGGNNPVLEMDHPKRSRSGAVQNALMDVMDEAANAPG